jgi:leucyl/phenylalanyl-tRNA--protein transferase
MAVWQGRAVMPTPVEPPETGWRFGPPSEHDGDVVAVGADLQPGTILAAYRAGLFPMPVDGRTTGWWSPDPRGVLPIEGLRVSRSLRKACRRYEIRVDTAFEAVIDACADPDRDGRWITPEIRAAYVGLHRLGWAHSVEAWWEGELAGGLYGLAIGGLFAGESMFHRRTDASKAALVGLVERLREGDDGRHRLLDVQWRTEHLASLGAVEVDRSEYLGRLLPKALAARLPAAFAGGHAPPRVANRP